MTTPEQSAAIARIRTDVSEAEAAYGLLWRMWTADKAIHAARHSLLAMIGKEGQRRGIQWALDTFGSNSEPRLEDLP